MFKHLALLNDISHILGLIGIIEYSERESIAAWMESEASADPRLANVEVFESTVQAIELDDEPQLSTKRVSEASPDPLIELVMLQNWVFTLGDRDCFPSVPHGHWSKKTNPWPKLNPFSGRVYRDSRNEDLHRRLSKEQMRTLWRNEDFVEFCREQVLWYSDFAPKYRFARARRGKFIFPTW